MKTDCDLLIHNAVVLTLDQVIQHIVEEEANRLVREFQPEKLHIIVTKPKTGEILAMANYPPFDPNRFARADADARRDPLRVPGLRTQL